MLGWVGSLINNGFGLGKQYLQNKGRVADAEVAYELAKLNAKTEQASDEMRYELEQLKHTGNLDFLAVKQSNKSLWDEFLCLLFLSPVGFVIYGTITEAPAQFWAASILSTLENLPTWYLVVVGLIFVRYLGFRSLLRVGLKMWGKKVFDLKLKSEEGRNENGRKGKADQEG